MATVEREYDIDGSTFDFGGDSPSLDGSGGEEDGGSGCIGHLLWALAIYGVAIVLAIVLPRPQPAAVAGKVEVRAGASISGH